MLLAKWVFKSLCKAGLKYFKSFSGNKCVYILILFQKIVGLLLKWNEDAHQNWYYTGYCIHDNIISKLEVKLDLCIVNHVTFIYAEGN